MTEHTGPDVREKELDEAREEGFQEGYSEGQNDANHASQDTFHRVIAWLRKRDLLQDADYPEGYTAEDIADALNEHEENLVSLSKRAALEARPSPATEGEVERIGPRARVLVCKGCPAFETEAWREPSGDGETYDSGQYAWCNAAGRRSMGAYHYDHNSAPEWCPARAALSAARPSREGEMRAALEKIAAREDYSPGETEIRAIARAALQPQQKEG